jgi:heme exporter protein D
MNMAALGPHAGFIVGSYLVVAVVVIGLIAAVIGDYRAQQNRLRDLERAGVTRRSGRSASDAA